MQKPSLFLFVPILALAALTACGGNKSTDTTTTTQNQPAAAPSANAMGGGAMSGAVAPVPATLHCGATAPVWANTKSHAYHLASDPLYGKTKHGQYMCASTAVAQGYHPAGSKAGGAMNGGHHHNKSGAMQAQPQPSPT